jgi:hypothetical protein
MHLMTAVAKPRGTRNLDAGKSYARHDRHDADQYQQFLYKDKPLRFHLRSPS